MNGRAPMESRGVFVPCKIDDKVGSVTSAAGGSGGDSSVGGTLPLELALTAAEEPDCFVGVSCIRGVMEHKHYLFFYFKLLELVF